jgi:hypothetical protein
MMSYVSTSASRTPGQLRRWRTTSPTNALRLLVTRQLAEWSTGEERDILLARAHAEEQHELHWPSSSARMLGRSAATCAPDYLFPGHPLRRSVCVRSDATCRGPLTL